ncbi:MAG: hypothetical protein ACPKNR_08745 [Pleomorphochaeta sp.]
MVYLYYIKSLKSILLNPFYKNKNIGDLNSEEPITILSANTITKDDNEYITQVCFEEIDQSVNLWIQEKRYYLRLLASTFAFFIMYFFLSLVIRDPIPLLDEFVGSGAFAIFVWNFFSKRDKKSAIARKKKLEIKRQVNSANNNELVVLRKIEDYIFNLSSRDNLDIADAITLVEGEIVSFQVEEDEKQYLDDILRLLKLKLFENNKIETYYKKLLKVNETNIKDEALSSRLIEFGKPNKFDLLLLYLIIAIEKDRAK